LPSKLAGEHQKKRNAMRLKPSIAGQVVVLTGASSGIGAAAAVDFSKHGAQVVLVARSEEALEGVRSRLSAPEQAVSIAADVTDAESLNRVACAAAERFGRIDVWVNNAVAAMYGDFDRVPLADFRQVIETAFFGCVHGCAAVLPYFQQQRSGVLINVASVLGVLGIPHMSSYVAAKHAVVGFSESLRQELSDTGIEVCTLVLGSVDTPFYEHAGNVTGHRVRPLPPACAPERVARAIVRLANTPQKQLFVPAGAAALPLLRAVSPQLTERISAWLVDRFQIRKESAEPTRGNLYQPIHNQGDRHTANTVGLTAAALGGGAILFLLLSRRRGETKSGGWRTLFA
jgi:short-subunit dehydrogenase